MTDDISILANFNSGIITAGLTMPSPQSNGSGMPSTASGLINIPPDSGKWIRVRLVQDGRRVKELDCVSKMEIFQPNGTTPWKVIDGTIEMVLNTIYDPASKAMQVIPLPEIVFPIRSDIGMLPARQYHFRVRLIDFDPTLGDITIANGIFGVRNEPLVVLPSQP